MSGERNYVRKPLEEMDVIDDFLFMELVTDETKGLEVCRIILSRILKREIGEISYVAQKIVPEVSESSHGIRLDVYIREEREPSEHSKADINVYDIEPDNRCAKKKWLPRRSRYYGSLIDAKLLKTNIDYDKLPDLVTIFILSYDPFGEGDMYYEAGTVLRTHPEIPYNDGVRRIYLYVGGKLPEDAGDDDKRLQDLLKYIGKSTLDNVVDDKIEKLDNIVRETKADANVGVRYMKSWEWEKEIREEIREEVREEERKKTEAERKRADEAEAKLREYRESREEWYLYHLISQVQKKILRNKDFSVIVEELESDEDEIRPIYDAVLKYGADLSPEEIREKMYTD